MSALSFSHVSRAQKTFAVALAVLSAVGIAQVLTGLYLYARHPADALPPEKKAAVNARLFRTVKPTPSAAPVKIPAVAGVPSATVKRAPVAPAAMASAAQHVAART